MSDVKPTHMAFEQRYGDDSGVEYAVRLTISTAGRVIEFESINSVEFPIEELNWLIACLQRIQQEIPR